MDIDEQVLENGPFLDPLPVLEQLQELVHRTFTLVDAQLVDLPVGLG